MSTSFKKIQPPILGQASRQEVAEKHWKKFKNPVILQQISAVTHINVCESAPHYYAVSSSTRVIIMDPEADEPVKNFTRFKDVAYGGILRHDGKLLAAGGAEGIVKIFSMDGKTQLRNLRGHSGEVRAVKFGWDNVSALSASDDTTVRLWDIALGRELTCMNGHTDHVRSAASAPRNPDYWATGSYDQTVKLWDARTKAATTTLDHGHPVESVLMFPSGSILVSAGGNEIKVWDLLAGGKLLNTISAHQKAITCLALDSAGARLFSGSLDQHVKVYDVMDFSVKFSFTYSAPVLSLGIAPDDSYIVAGMSDGAVAIKKRSLKRQDVVKAAEKLETARSQENRFFVKSRGSKQHKDDYLLEVEKKVKLRDFEKSLKRFEYKRALDLALKKWYSDMISVISLLEELMRRDGLTIAFSGRDEYSLKPLLSFLIYNISDRRWSVFVIQVTEFLLDLYSNQVGKSEAIDEMLRKLQSRVQKEVDSQKKLFSLLGALDMILTASSANAISASALDKLNIHTVIPNEEAKNVESANTK